MASNRESPGGSGKKLPSWRELTKEQQYVLNEARMHHRLIDIQNGWGEPSLDWKAKGAYANSLASAAKSLVTFGLIDVYKEPADVGEPELLFREEAAETVGDPGNWWGENWDEEPSPDEERTSVVNFTLVATEAARALAEPFTET